MWGSNVGSTIPLRYLQLIKMLCFFLAMTYSAYLGLCFTEDTSKSIINMQSDYSLVRLYKRVLITLFIKTTFHLNYNQIQFKNKSIDPQWKLSIYFIMYENVF